MVRFKEKRINEVLTWQLQIEIDPLKIPELSVESKNLYPFYGQATINKGIISYLSLKDEVLNNKEGKPTILIHSNNQNVVYLQTPFYLKDGHGATSFLQADFLNEKNALYIMACIKKVISKKFTYNEKATKIALKNTYIQLPVNDNDEIDYEYIERYISELEEERVSKLEKERVNELAAYLSVSGLEDYELTDEERNAVSRFNSKRNFKQYSAAELFSVSANAQLNKDSFHFSGKAEYPYFTRTVLNNGILGYVEYLDEEHKISGNSIAVGMLGMQFFYMSHDFYAGQFTKTVFPKFQEFDETIAQYFITVFNKNSKRYLGGLVRDFENLFNETIIELPINDDKIDYLCIRNYIIAQEKFAIKDVVDWKNKIISTTKKLIV